MKLLVLSDLHAEHSPFVPDPAVVAAAVELAAVVVAKPAVCAAVVAATADTCAA
mgnify:CR=1 FL=1